MSPRLRGLGTRNYRKNSSCLASFLKRFFSASSISSITPNNFRRIVSADLGNFFNSSAIRMQYLPLQRILPIHPSSCHT